MPENGCRLAGVVVLHHPDESVEDNIRSYLPQVSLLVVVDNSPSIRPSLRAFLSGSEKILYLGDGTNRGIAAALNLGAEKAVESGFSHLLTMDQDSRFEAGALEILCEFSESHPESGIAAPRPVLAGKLESNPSTEEREVSHVIMSGNVLNLQAYRDAGPFLEKLFIDYVDYEYCLRLRRCGHGVWVVPRARLFHSLGKIEPRNFLGMTFHPTNHSPVRKYYATRNRLYVMKTYPGFIPGEIWAWAKEIVKLFLFEGERFSKLGFILQGVMDFLKGRYGPLNRKGSRK